MNYDPDDLLDHVDQWKLKLSEKLNKMTPEEEQEFWRQSREKARAMGIIFAGDDPPTKSQPKRKRRKTG